jgi:hypothetical protein
VRGTTDGLTISNGKSYGDPSFDKLKKLEVGKESFSEMLMERRIYKFIKGVFAGGAKSWRVWRRSLSTRRQSRQVLVTGLGNLRLR